jgi:lysophospholipase L1-like esterase
MVGGDAGRDRTAPARATGSRRRLQALAVVTAAFLATAYLAVTREATPPPFSAAPGGGDTTVGLPGRASALFVGDDFAAGIGTSGPEEAYACLTAELMDWVCNLDAQRGTGYLADGAADDPTSGPFEQRLDDSADRYLADVVIVDGGRNDASRSPDQVAAAADAYLARVRAYWPEAVLVVLTPAFLDSTRATVPFGEELTDLLAPIVAAHGGTLIDPIAADWVSPDLAPSLISADGVHPNPDGHEYLAEWLAEALRSRGLDALQLTDRPDSAVG